MERNFTEWVGRSVTRSDVITPRLLAEYRATLSPYLFEAADDICPPGFHLTLAPTMPFPEETGPDGAEAKGLFLPPIGLPRRMWAGGLMETLRALRVGAEVTRTTTITDVRWKQGSTGPLCLVSTLHEIADRDGIAIRERQDLVFREAAVAPAAAAGPARDLAADWLVDASPLLLFRFSAITFNGHRIHYDVPYAAEEGYPGLLVHGPMQGVLMLNLVARRLGRVPGRLDYRCLAPLYAGASFGVAWDDASSTVRVLRSDGVTTAEGRAHAPGTC